MRHFRCFLVLGVFCLVGAVMGENTITTATPLVPTSARPTTLLRVIQVHPEDFQEQTNASINSRRSMKVYAKIWDWDYWCLLQPKTGNCGKNETKYYYSVQTDQCMTFTYTGCEGPKSNKNRFDTVEDCEHRCKGASIMPVNTTKDCELQPNTGLCLGRQDWYYYDVNESACKTFVYGGCGGNLNRFKTLQECQSGCGNFGRSGKSDKSDESGERTNVSFDDSVHRTTDIVNESDDRTSSLDGSDEGISVSVDLSDYNIL